MGTDPVDDRVLGLLHAADAERRQQGALVRQEQGEAVLERAEEGDVKGCRGRGGGEGRTAGDHRVPPRAAEISEARWPYPEGCPVDGPPWNGQDASRARGGG